MKPSLSALLAVVGVLAPAASARADQCAWLDDAEVVGRAVAALEASPTVIAFCEPCGASVPDAPVPVRSVQVRPVAADAEELVVNGEGIDLAYTYVQTRTGAFENLAALAGCSATGVSARLEATQETSTGVLIFADDTDAPAPGPAATPAPAPSVPPPCPAPPALGLAATPVAPAPPALTTIIVQVQRTPAVWFFVLGALFTALPLALAGLWLSLGRRRRQHRPRAGSL